MSRVRRMSRSGLLAACQARGHKRMGWWDGSEVSNVRSRGLSGLDCSNFRELRFDPERSWATCACCNAAFAFRADTIKDSRWR